MAPRGISSATNALILGSVVLAYPLAATAQRHGGVGGTGGSGLSGITRPTGVDEKDTLKDFHQAMAMQATSQQIAEFQSLVKSTEAAKAELQVLLEQLHKENAAPESPRRDNLDQLLENARTWNKKFQQGFSPAQKSGLKDIAKRLAKADSDLEQGQKRLDQSLDVKTVGPEVAAYADSLDKTLTDFYNQQLTLGREMSITLASGQDMAFTLPRVKNPVSIANLTLAVPVSGMLSQVAARGGQRTFKMELTADLSDLQQNITELVRAQLDTSATCGQRVAIRQARLTPLPPASLLVVQLHFERWTCTRTFGQQTANELAEGDGTVEIKLTPAVENANTWKIISAFGRIDATGMMLDALRSGSFGEDLLDKTAQSVLSAARAGSDFKLALPLAVQNSAVLQSARFQDAGVGSLTIVLDGQIQISDEQADQLASQLNQAFSAQGTPAPGATPQLAKRPQ
jgi:hypothetical protein